MRPRKVDHGGIIWIIIAAGMFLPIQAGINSQLSKFLGQPFQAAFISFLGGTLIMFLLSVLFNGGLPEWSVLSRISPVYMIGGLLGSVMVMAAIFFAPRVGAATLVSCLITGQLLFSVVLDHFGWLGFPHHPLSLVRATGVCLLFAGIYLVRNF